MKKEELSSGFFLGKRMTSLEEGKIFVPTLVSWNVTLKCNLRCSHCYIDAQIREATGELTTAEGKMLIDQIAEVSKPILILSGGEPLLREDIFELARYGSEKGLKVTMGTNGTLVDDESARRLRDAGVRKVAISLDSISPEKHDIFRGLRGAWKATIKGIDACQRNGLDFQVNTTVTKQNFEEVDEIISFAQRLGASNFHLFFLVPTGRGEKLEDLTPVQYEEMLRKVIKEGARRDFDVRPTCAPQFMRIAKQEMMNLEKWGRGCIAGIRYCRIYPTGDVTPCPYLPVKVGNIRESSFKEIWFNSDVLNELRDLSKLKGRCGICEYKDICGGCRARAYGLTSNFIDICGSLSPPSEIKGDYLAEEPWCIYQPRIT